MLKKFLLFWLIYCCFIELSKSANFDECNGIPDESFVAYLENCRSYVYCNGEDSMLGDCDEGQYFDAEAVACDLAENVYCPLDEPKEPEKPEEPETTASTTAATTTKITTTAIIETTSSTVETITVPPIVQVNCPVTDDPQQIVLIPNNQTCSDYYLCYHGYAIEMQCTNHLHFNTYTGKCDFPENVNCLNDRPSANKCLSHVTDFFPHPENCNYFYYCIKGFMTVQQCPFLYGWDIERRSCVQLSQAKCFNSDKILIA